MNPKLSYSVVSQVSEYRWCVLGSASTQVSLHLEVLGLSVNSKL